MTDFKKKIANFQFLYSSFPLGISAKIAEDCKCNNLAPILLLSAIALSQITFISSVFGVSFAIGKKLEKPNPEIFRFAGLITGAVVAGFILFIIADTCLRFTHENNEKQETAIGKEIFEDVLFAQALFSPVNLIFGAIQSILYEYFTGRKYTILSEPSAANIGARRQ